MNNPFEHSSSTWVRYNAYEWKKDKNGVLYISPADDAKPSIYDPLENPDELILDVISTGMACMKEDAETEKKSYHGFHLQIRITRSYDRAADHAEIH